MDDLNALHRIMDVFAEALDTASAQQQMREAQCVRAGHQWRAPVIPALPAHEQDWLRAHVRICERCKRVEHDAPPAWGSEPPTS